MTPEETKNLVHNLQLRLEKAANKKTKAWWERYIKHGTLFRGVGIPKIREELTQWRAKERIDTLSPNDQLDVAFSFFAQMYAEDKLAGVLFLQYYLYNKLDWKLLISRFEKIFDNEYIYDWNVCDWFSVRVLGPMIKENGVPCAKAIAKWSTSKNVWQARASVVAFANYTKHPKYKLLILGSCSKLIRREDRFAKTAVGWILRELSKTDKKAVLAFIEKHARYFSKESLENGMKKLSLSEKEKLKNRFMENKYLEEITTLLKQVHPKLFTIHRLEFKNVFGAVAGYVNGKIFITCGKFGVALKLPPETLEEIFEGKDVKQLKYFSEGHVKKDYAVLPKRILENKSQFQKLIDISIQFVETLTLISKL